MKKYLFSILFATFCFVASGQQFGDFEVVCWDSAGVVTPLQVRVSSRNTDGKLIYTFYRLNYAPGVLDTKKVVPTVGTVGACGNSQLQSIIVNLQNNLIDNDTIIVRLDSLLSGLDSLLSNTEQPQRCDCTYTVVLENSVVTIADNADRPVWNYDIVARRDCGLGAEEVFRQATSTITPGELGQVRQGYTVSSALANGGVIDSVKIYVANPTATFNVYLSPHMVKVKYPLLSIDTALLRFNTATSATYNTAIQQVMAYAVSNWAITQVPALPFVNQLFTSKVESSGRINLQWASVNNPSGPLAGLIAAAGSRRIWYHNTASGSQLNSQGAYSIGINGVATVSYNLPCDTTIFTSYTLGITAGVGSVGLDSIDVNPSPVPTLSGTVGTGTCMETCGGGECLEICNTIANPIPVQIVEAECKVLGLSEFPLTLSSSTGTLPGATYHSISISVTSGTVIISATNTSGTTSASFGPGEVFNATAKECSFIPTTFSINATAGVAKVASIR